MNRISAESIKICNDYKTLKKTGNMPLNEEQFIRWCTYLYEVDYATAKNGISLALDDLAKEQQTELSQDADKDKALDNIVNNLDNKLEPEEQEIKEKFSNE